MANTKINTQLTLEFKFTLELNLEEAKALHQMTVYGAKAFLEGYYKQLGKSYMQPHENGIISMFNTIKNTLPAQIKNADKIIEEVKNIQL